MDWDDLRIALAVVRAGSLSAAARALGSTQPTVSRRLEALEQHLGARLFEREAGGLRLSALGRSLVADLERMDEGALALQQRIAARDTGLQGEIVVTSLDWLGDEVLAPLLAEFGQQHPGLQIELCNDTKVFNLARREADLAFRFGAFEQENLIERRVGEVAYALYASTDYLHRRGRPDPAHGFAGQALVLLDRAAGAVPHEEWLLALAPRAQIALRCNGLRGHLAAVRAGAALAVLPRLLGDREPGLQRLALDGVAMPVRAVRVGLHAGMRDTPRIRALLDFAVAGFEALRPQLNPAP
ncbi:LysR family transcriptional regulator [Roseateles sp. DAIF2]|uniref:LysR family transcriptional regulator n=1 Tax=Roseateles sp. DAIF2 TaxID=2714952 RepID=UPI0018A2878B|nr:LysR family transcriptional regulator [Roseateles sp. DAIF2]QPF73932.1 LysR family transcriptional regulator [Roseateles sp. DAIF2]